MPHTDLPRTNYPDRPYDQMAPYDWAIEGVFEDGPAGMPAGRERRTFFDRLDNDFKFLGSIMLASLALALAGTVISKLEGNPAVSEPVAQEIPSALPKPVQDNMKSAVRVSYEPYPYGTRYGSGVKIGPDLVLTAGHVIDSRNPSERIDCAGTYVTSVLGVGQYDPRHEVVNFVTSHDNTDHDNRGRDLAILRVGEDDTFASLPTPEIATERPSVGAAVFFINYETGGPNSDVFHVPNQSMGIGPFVQGDGKYFDSAAEYAGTVVDNYGPYLEVATSVRGYGSKKDMQLNSWPGASGGPVFDAEGKLIGESVAIDYDPMTIRQIHRTNGIQLTHPYVRRISIVQPITKAILRPYIKAVPDRPIC